MTDLTGGSIVYQGETLAIEPEESVLGALLRNGHSIRHSCQAGACQSCLMQAHEDSRAVLPSASQQPLSPAQRQQGFFLACCAYPESKITASLPDDAVHPTVSGVVTGISPLAADVIQLSVKADLKYEAGQFVNLRVSSTSGEEIQRSYSLVTAPTDGADLIFHIKLLSDGRFSRWLQQEAKVGDGITLAGPHGTCQVSFDDLKNQHTVLAGTGTGLAPLLAIREALHEQQYAGDIHLIFSNRDLAGFYCIDTLVDLARKQSNLSLHLLTLDESATAPYTQADVYQYVKSLPLEFASTSVFLCGADSFVKKMRKACFLQGVAMKNIKADAFVAS